MSKVGIALIVKKEDKHNEEDSPEVTQEKSSAIMEKLDKLLENMGSGQHIIMHNADNGDSVFTIVEDSVT